MPKSFGTHQCAECDDSPGPVLAYGSRRRDQDPHGLADPVMKAWSAQLVHRQGYNGQASPVGVLGIGIAHTTALLGIHAERFGDCESVGCNGAGEDRAVGCGSFDDP
jgi:hypothetical protein